MEIKEHEPAELKRLLENFCAEVKNKYDLLALPTVRVNFFVFTLISNHKVFLVDFGIK